MRSTKQELWRWGRMTAGLGLVLLAGLSFAGCGPSLSQIREWQKAGALEPLILALNDKNEDVRWRAAEALGKIGNTKAIGPLEELVQNDPNSNTRDAAKEALWKLRGK